MRKPHPPTSKAARRKARRKALAQAAAHAALHGGGDPSPLTVRIIVQIGVLMSLAIVVLTGLTAIATGSPMGVMYWKTFGLVMAHFGGGSLLNASAGNELNLPTWFVIAQSVMQDIAIVSFTYALFAWGYKRFSHWPVIGRNLDGAHKAALEHIHIVRPYGMLGLFMFVLLPLLGTGPIVATIIGYILGLGAFTTLFTVSLSCFVVTIGYVYFYGWLANWNPGVALSLLGVLVVLAVLGVLIAVVRYLWVKEEKQTPPPATPPLQG